MSSSLQWLLDFDQQGEPSMSNGIQRSEEIIETNSISDSSRSDGCLISILRPQNAALNITMVNKFKKDNIKIFIS
jgi:hypothetical protein